jgi:hypothetical protein
MGIIKSLFSSYNLQISKLKYKKYELNNPGDYYSENPFAYYRCIFIHIPKSAGISVSKALFGSLGAGHRTIEYWQSKLTKRIYKTFFKFTIVRNPYDRLLSAYNFLKKGGIHKVDAEFASKNLIHFNSFEDFVMNYLNEETLYSHIHFYPQVYFLKNHKGIIDMDFIGKYENITEDFKFIADKLKITTKLDEHNTGEMHQDSFKTHYTTEMIKKINKLYNEDFDPLGYCKV